MRRRAYRAGLDERVAMCKAAGAEIVPSLENNGWSANAKFGEEDILLGHIWFRERGMYAGCVLIELPYLKEWLFDKGRKHALKNNSPKVLTNDR